MTVNQIYKATFTFNAPTSDGDMVFTSHYRTTAVSSPISDQAEAQEIADELGDNCNTIYLPLIPDSTTFTEVRVVGITNPLVQAIFASGLPGLDVAEACPLRCSPVIKLGTGLRGRSYNGRMFMMAPSEAQQSAGGLLAAYMISLALFQATIQRVSLGVSGNIYDQTILSPTLSTPPSVFVDNLVSSSTVNAVMGSQRGRQAV